MNEHESDILLNRYLDGRLDPEGVRHLEQELAGDEALQQQLEQLRVADRLLKQSLTVSESELDGHFSAIYGQAQVCLEDQPVASGRGKWLRFAAGLAAGLAIGWAGHLMMSPAPVVESATDLAQPIQTQFIPPIISTPTGGSGQPLPVVRDVDLYIYTDNQGDRWVLEGIRENRLKPEIHTVVY